MIRYRIPAAIVGCLALVAVLSASVWACVPQPIVEIKPSYSGPSGTKLDISALNFNPGRVEIRWNSMDGAEIGTGNGPNFSAQATVPRARPGLYVIFLVSRENGGGVGATARMAFEVTGTGKRHPSNSKQKTVAREQQDGRSDGGSIGMVALGGALVAIGFALGALYYRNNQPFRRKKEHMATDS